MQWLIPPRLVMLAFVVSVAVGSTFPIMGPAATRWRLAGIVPICAGVVLLGLGSGLFGRRETNIKTFEDPGQLVADGPFRFTRNPMYLGFTLFLSGLALAVGSLTAWIGPLVFFVAANVWYVPFEEDRMAEHFGEAYADYQRRVPRWIGPVRSA